MLVTLGEFVVSLTEPDGVRLVLTEQRLCRQSGRHSGGERDLLRAAGNSAPLLPPHCSLCGLTTLGLVGLNFTV